MQTPTRPPSSTPKHFSLRQRLGLEMGELPLTLTELERQLAALERAGLVRCVDKKWEHIFRAESAAKDRQGELWKLTGG